MKLDFHRLFFKALGHPRIVKYLEENLIPEKNRRYFCDVFPDSVSRIESFLGDVENDCIHMNHFQGIVTYLNGISNTLGLWYFGCFISKIIYKNGKSWIPKGISFKYARTYSRIGIEYKIRSDME